MRYSTNEADKLTGSESFPSQNMMPAAGDYYANNDYKINRPVRPGQRAVDITELDGEDRSLLDRFYEETRGQDPFLGESLTPQSLWEESDQQNLERLNLPQHHHQQQQHPNNNDNLHQRQQNMGVPSIASPPKNDGWTIDQQLIDQSKMLSSLSDILPMASGVVNTGAHYSPSLRLLTSYDPIAAADQTPAEPDNRGLRSNRIVGATVYGRNELTKANVSSKSPIEAVRLHDQLMDDPPHDGMVRVRMYFHRAIHDDAKLYGTGPWRYWGHGWGVEFGYHPHKEHQSRFYQKGYTIERAFGRDFCKDPKKCRPADPNFFKDSMNRVHEYNGQQRPAVEVRPYVDGVKVKGRNR